MTIQRIEASVTANQEAVTNFTNQQAFLVLASCSQPVLVSFDDEAPLQYPAETKIIRSFTRVAFQYVATKFDGNPADATTTLTAYSGEADDDLDVPPASQRIRYVKTLNQVLTHGQSAKLFPAEEKRVRVDLIFTNTTNQIDTSAAFSNPMTAGSVGVILYGNGNEIWVKNTAASASITVYAVGHYTD